MGSRDKDQPSSHHQPLLSSLVIRPSLSDGGDGRGGGGGRAGGSDYEPVRFAASLRLILAAIATLTILASGLRVPGEQGPKTSEVYGFVGSITTIVATVTFLVWAYVPESCLHPVGIFYYPSRYWALAIPTYTIVAIVLALGFYIGMNLLSTPPPASLSTVFDEYSRDPTSSHPMVEGDEKPIEPISDIGIDKINALMFDDMK